MKKYYIEKSSYGEDIYYIKLTNYPGLPVAVISACRCGEEDLKEILEVIENADRKTRAGSLALSGHGRSDGSHQRVG